MYYRCDMKTDIKNVYNDLHGLIVTSDFDHT